MGRGTRQEGLGALRQVRIYTTWVRAPTAGVLQEAGRGFRECSSDGPGITGLSGNARLGQA